MASYASKFNRPPVVASANGTAKFQYYPQDAATTNVHAMLPMHVHQAKHPADVYALYYSRSSDPSVRTFDVINDKSAGDWYMKALLCMFKAVIYKRRNLMPVGDVKLTAPFWLACTNQVSGAIDGYMLIYIESVAEEKENANQKYGSSEVMRRRVMPFDMWVNQLVNGVAFPSLIELAKDSQSNDDQQKLSPEDQDAWAALRTLLNNPAAYRNACDFYTQSPPSEANIAETVMWNISSRHHPYNPRKIFTVANAMAARQREVGSANVKLVAEKDGKIAALHVNSLAQLTAMLSNVDELLRFGPPRKTPSHWLHPHLCHPSVFYTLYQPHIKPVFDPQSDGFKQLQSKKRPGVSDDQLQKLYQNVISWREPTGSDIEKHRTQSRLRVSLAGGDPVKVAIERKHAMNSFPEVWNTAVAKEYEIGVNKPAILYANRFRERQESMATPVILTNEFQTPGLQSSQSDMIAYDVCDKVATAHVEVLIHDMAAACASRDNNKEHVNILNVGGPGLGKSNVQKLAIGHGLSGAIVSINQETAMANTGDQHQRGYFSVKDEVNPTEFGMSSDTKLNSLYGLIALVRGRVKNTVQTNAMAQWKQRTTGRVCNVSTIDMKEGRKSKRTSTIQFGVESISMNIAYARLPAPIIDRCIVRQYYKTMRKDGVDILTTRMSNENESERMAAAERLKSCILFKTYGCTIMNVLESHMITNPTNTVAMSSTIDVVTRVMSGMHVPNLRDSRGFGSIESFAIAAAQRNALAITFGLGIGGTDPTRHITEHDIGWRTQPYNVVDLNIATHVIELLDSYLPQLETQSIIAAREVIFGAFYEFQRNEDNGKGNGNQKVPVFTPDHPGASPCHIVPDGDYLVVRNLFSKPAHRRRPAAVPVHAGVQSAPPQHGRAAPAAARSIGAMMNQVANDAKNNGAKEGEIVIPPEPSVPEDMLTELEKFQLLQRYVDSGSDRKVDPDELIATLASLCNPRLMPKSMNEKGGKQSFSKRAVMYIDEYDLKFHKGVLDCASMDLVFEIIQAVFRDVDTGNDICVRGHVEDNYFEFKTGKIGVNAEEVLAASMDDSSPPPPPVEEKKAVEAKEQPDPAAAASAAPMTDMLDAAFEDAPDSSASAASVVPPPKAASPPEALLEKPAKSPSQEFHERLVKAFGMKPFKELRQVNNPDFVDPKVRDRMVAAGYVTSKEGTTYSSVAKRDGGLLDMDRIMREHLKQLRALDIDNILGIPKDDVELEQYHAMPVIHRKLRSVCYHFHAAGNEAKTAFFKFTNQKKFSSEQAADLHQKVIVACEKMVAYYTSIDRHYGLRYTPTVGSTEYWLHAFELKLTEAIPEQDYNTREVVMVQRDMISRFVLKWITLALQYERSKRSVRNARDAMEPDAVDDDGCAVANAKSEVEAAIEQFIDTYRTGAASASKKAGSGPQVGGAARKPPLPPPPPRVPRSPATSLPLRRPSSPQKGGRIDEKHSHAADPAATSEMPPLVEVNDDEPSAPPSPPPAAAHPVDPAVVVVASSSMSQLYDDDDEPAAAAAAAAVSQAAASVVPSLAQFIAASAAVAPPPPSAHQSQEPQLPTTEEIDAARAAAIAEEDERENRREALFASLLPGNRRKKKAPVEKKSAAGGGAGDISFGGTELKSDVAESTSAKLTAALRENRKRKAEAAAAVEANMTEEEKKQQKKPRKKRGKKRSEFVADQAGEEGVDSDGAAVSDDDAEEDEDAKSDTSESDDGASPGTKNKRHRADKEKSMEFRQRHERKEHAKEVAAIQREADRLKRVTSLMNDDDDAYGAGAAQADMEEERKRVQFERDMQQLRVVDPEQYRELIQVQKQAEAAEKKRAAEEEAKLQRALSIADAAARASSELKQQAAEEAQLRHERALLARTLVTEKLAGSALLLPAVPPPPPVAANAADRAAAEAAEAAGVDSPPPPMSPSAAAVEEDEIDAAAMRDN